MLKFYTFFGGGSKSIGRPGSTGGMGNSNTEQKPSLTVTLTKGGSWALLRKSAVKSTALAQPFCVNQAVGDLPQRLHAESVAVRQFSHWATKLQNDVSKTLIAKR